MSHRNPTEHPSTDFISTTAELRLLNLLVVDASSTWLAILNPEQVEETAHRCIILACFAQRPVDIGVSCSTNCGSMLPVLSKIHAAAIG